MSDSANRQDTLSYKLESVDSFGGALKRERELRSIPLEDVAKATNIQLCYLQSLEADDFEHLPHATFVKGFIRSYSSYIGLNPDNVMANYEHFIANIPEDEIEDRHPEHREEKAGNKNTAVLAIVISIIIVLAVLGYYLVGSINSLNKPPASVTHTLPQSSD